MESTLSYPYVYSYIVYIRLVKPVGKTWCIVLFYKKTFLLIKIRPLVWINTLNSQYVYGKYLLFYIKFI